MTRRAALLAALVVAFMAVLVAVETKWGPVRRLDERVVHHLHRRAVQHPGEVSLWKWVSDVGSPTVLRIAAVVAAVALGLWRSRRAALLVIVTMAGAWLLEVTVKAAVGRDRPVFVEAVAHARGAAFPSGHVLTSLVAFGLLVLLVPHRARSVVAAVAAVAVVLVGYSRLALGVHFLTDVAGGWLLGAAWLTAAFYLFSGRSLPAAEPPAPDRPRETRAC